MWLIEKSMTSEVKVQAHGKHKRWKGLNSPTGEALLWLVMESHGPLPGGPEVPSFVSGLGPAWLGDMEGRAPQASL